MTRMDDYFEIIEKEAFAARSASGTNPYDDSNNDRFGSSTRGRDRFSGFGEDQWTKKPTRNGNDRSSRFDEDEWTKKPSRNSFPNDESNDRYGSNSRDRDRFSSKFGEDQWTKKPIRNEDDRFSKVNNDDDEWTKPPSSANRGGGRRSSYDESKDDRYGSKYPNGRSSRDEDDGNEWTKQPPNRDSGNRNESKDDRFGSKYRDVDRPSRNIDDNDEWTKPPSSFNRDSGARSSYAESKDDRFGSKYRDVDRPSRNNDENDEWTKPPSSFNRDSGARSSYAESKDDRFGSKYRDVDRPSRNIDDDDEWKKPSSSFKRDSGARSSYAESKDDRFGSNYRDCSSKFDDDWTNPPSNSKANFKSASPPSEYRGVDRSRRNDVDRYNGTRDSYDESKGDRHGSNYRDCASKFDDDWGSAPPNSKANFKSGSPPADSWTKKTYYYCPETRTDNFKDDGKATSNQWTPKPNDDTPKIDYDRFLVEFKYPRVRTHHSVVEAELKNQYNHCQDILVACCQNKLSLIIQRNSGLCDVTTEKIQNEGLWVFSLTEVTPNPDELQSAHSFNRTPVTTFSFIVNNPDFFKRPQVIINYDLDWRKVKYLERYLQYRYGNVESRVEIYHIATPNSQNANVLKEIFCDD